MVLGQASQRDRPADCRPGAVQIARRTCEQAAAPFQFQHVQFQVVSQLGRLLEQQTPAWHVRLEVEQAATGDRQLQAVRSRVGAARRA
jgi:hypothetical protein